MDDLGPGTEPKEASMPEAMVVESSRSTGADEAASPLTQPGRLRSVEIIVPWQLSDTRADAREPAVARPAAPAPLDPACEMVVDWQMNGPVFTRSSAGGH